LADFLFDTPFEFRAHALETATRSLTLGFSRASRSNSFGEELFHLCTRRDNQAMRCDKCPTDLSARTLYELAANHPGGLTPKANHVLKTTRTLETILVGLGFGLG
jgi:hypothetical protein